MKKSILILLCLPVFFSCTNKLYVADSAFEKTYLPFIVDKISGREEIILKLGEPSWSFENGRILTYRVSVDSKGNLKPVRIVNDKNNPSFSYTYPLPVKFYSLVLIFSENNILQKHSLLLTNP